MSDKKKIVNVIITNVSSIRAEQYRKNKYIYEDDKINEANTIEGCVTNEPPIKYLIKDLNKNKQILDKVILIASKDANEPIKQVNNSIPKSQFEQDFNYNEVSSVDILIKKISDFCKYENYPFPDMNKEDCINLGGGKSDDEVTSAITEVHKMLVELLQNNNNQVNVYIEANGGIRYVLVMLISVINSLEKVYDNIKIKKIFSMAVYDKDNDGRIYIRDTSMIYASIDLVSAITEFMNYGRIKSLQDYFRKRKEISKKDIQNFSEKVFDDIDKCINKLHKLSDDLQLCRTEQIIDDFYGDNNIQFTLKKFEHDYQNSKSNNVNAQIFIYVIQEILKEYEMIYKHRYDDEFLNLPTIIQWCVDKDYIQQALTFCSERLPKYMVENKIIKINKNLKDYSLKCASNQSKVYEENYYFLCQFINDNYNRLVSYSKLNELLDLYKEQYNSNGEISNLSDITDISKKLNDIIHIDNENEQDLIESIKQSFKDLLKANSQELEKLLDKTEKIIPKIKNKKDFKDIDNQVNTFDFNKYIEFYDEYLSKAIEFSQQLKNQIEKISEGTINNEKQYKKDSLKYAYFYLFDDKYLIPSDMDTFIKMQVIYGILKQQRNISNHASDSSKKIMY